MRRRLIGLLVTLALGLLYTPLATEAQPSAKVPRIGFLRPSLASPCRTDAFAQGLRELGYVESQNIVIEWRCADGTPERQRALAVELVQLSVDVFVAASPDGPLAAMQATRTIPIVLVAVPDPVAMGLVTSLAQPGGNVTGGANQVGREFPAKRRQLRLEAVPGVTRVAALQQGAFVRAVPARALIFWIVDNGSSHRGQTAIRRLAKAYANLIMVHTPVHASWLNQVEIYFSIVQRKVLTPYDFASLEDVEQRLRVYEVLSNQQPRPFEWQFTRAKLAEFLKRLEGHAGKMDSCQAVLEAPNTNQGEPLAA